MHPCIKTKNCIKCKDAKEPLFGQQRRIENTSLPATIGFITDRRIPRETMGLTRSIQGFSWLVIRLSRNQFFFEKRKKKRKEKHIYKVLSKILDPIPFPKSDQMITIRISGGISFKELLDTPFVLIRKNIQEKWNSGNLNLYSWLNFFFPLVQEYWKKKKQKLLSYCQNNNYE